MPSTMLLSMPLSSSALRNGPNKSMHRTLSHPSLVTAARRLEGPRLGSCVLGVAAVPIGNPPASDPPGAKWLAAAGAGGGAGRSAELEAS